MIIVAQISLTAHHIFYHFLVLLQMLFILIFLSSDQGYYYLKIKPIALTSLSVKSIPQARKRALWVSLSYTAISLLEDLDRASASNNWFSNNSWFITLVCAFVFKWHPLEILFIFSPYILFSYTFFSDKNSKNFIKNIVMVIYFFTTKLYDTSSAFILKVIEDSSNCVN